MKASELRAKSAAEVGNEVIELRKEQFKVRMQAATQQLTNTARIKSIRRDIARAKTVLSERKPEK